MDRDSELARLIETLAALLPPPADTVSQNVRVTGQRNIVQVAGRDLIRTERVIRRNTITPDERHLTVEQRERIREVAGELADRLAGDEGEANFAAVHRMLQCRFKIASYLLIPRGRYEEALGFLRQHRAINRSHLRSRNPVAYQNDFYRAIFAGARELGWHGEQVYRFATEKLGLKTAVASLKALGPVQLKALAGFIQPEVRSADLRRLTLRVMRHMAALRSFARAERSRASRGPHSAEASRTTLSKTKQRRYCRNVRFLNY